MSVQVDVRTYVHTYTLMYGYSCLWCVVEWDGGTSGTFSLGMYLSFIPLSP